MDLRFYQRHLDNVSRSFAYCIQRLDSPLRDWVSLMYLLCRILDTGEDVPWSHTKNQKIFFNKIRLYLQNKTEVSSLLLEDSDFLQNISVSEKKLIEDSKIIFQDFHNLSENIKTIIFELVYSMSLGMEYFLKNHTKNNKLKLQNMCEVNQYCFYVAGVVGEALTRLVAFRNEKNIDNDMISKSYHFGFFLQKLICLKIL